MNMFKNDPLAKALGLTPKTKKRKKKGLTAKEKKIYNKGKIAGMRKKSKSQSKKNKY
ncbi:hypothetical protein [Flavobacterium sp.]|uniref:hypothetical protein n=1 Tax=Flavobacterium sp. TaxID=239 RepID=UPI0025BFB27F|nr:hypothetical protein [Flavobacterium sp.]